MLSRNLVIILTDEEYETVHKRAEEKGISASKYARDLIFPTEDNFETKWNDLLDRINTYPSSAEFDVSMLMGRDLWNTYDRSTKLSLARTLSRKINDGTIKNVVPVGRSSSNVTIYKKL